MKPMSPRRLSAEQRAKLFKALSDPRRIDIVDALAQHGPQCGTELAERLGISLALLSHHWEVLVAAGLIRKKRVGQLRYCTLDAEKLQEATGGWDHPTESAELPPRTTKPKSKTKSAPKRALRNRPASRASRAPRSG
jgi:DNA-binding transcriptional ArsR family regulator